MATGKDQTDHSLLPLEERSLSNLASGSSEKKVISAASDGEPIKEEKGSSSVSDPHEEKITSVASDEKHVKMDEAASLSESHEMVASSSDSHEKKITLIAADGEKFEVEKATAIQSKTIKGLLEENDSFDMYPLPNITADILTKVIDFCRKHIEAGCEDNEEELKKFDADFVNVDKATLFHIILAANYLNIEALMDLTCQTVADIIANKPLADVREYFNVENDITPEEEAEYRKEFTLPF